MAQLAQLRSLSRTGEASLRRGGGGAGGGKPHTPRPVAFAFAETSAADKVGCPERRPHPAPASAGLSHLTNLQSGAAPPASSWPGLSRPSTSCEPAQSKTWMPGPRQPKAGHDERGEQIRYRTSSYAIALP